MVVKKSTITQKINMENKDYYQHEMLDRIHVLLETFDTHICNHPFNCYIKEDSEKIIDSLQDLYQKVGKLEIRDETVMNDNNIT